MNIDPSAPLQLLHRCPVYKPTPLVECRKNTELAFFIKDESVRMGLGSFKALGGVYAVAKNLMQEFQGVTGHTLSVDNLVSEEARGVAGNLTFVCASAGNHGLAVAAGAQLFGSKSRVYLSRHVPKRFEDELRRKSSTVIRAGDTYEDSVREAISDSTRTGATLLADSSWIGYTEQPTLIMSGYSVIAEELRDEFTILNEWPSHIFLQGGVGGLAASIACMSASNWGVRPQIVVVEPEHSACLKNSYEAGILKEAQGTPSNMGRLDCRVPSYLALRVLEELDIKFITLSDEEADSAHRQLGDLGFPTTPSGAAGFAGLTQWRKSCASIGTFRPLVIVTEGDAFGD